MVKPAATLLSEALALSTLSLLRCSAHSRGTLEFGPNEAWNVEKARASLLHVDEATEECHGRLQAAHARYDIACKTLEEKQAALNRAEAGVVLYAMRQRSNRA